MHLGTQLFLLTYWGSTLPNPIAEDLSGVGTNLDDPLGSSGGRDMIVGHGLAHGSIGEFPEIPNPGPASHNMLPAAQSSLYDDKLLMPPPPSNNLPRAARQTVPQDSQDHRYQVDEDISTSHPVAGTYGRERATIGSPDSLLPTKTELMTPHTGYGRSTGYQDVSDMETESNPSVHEDSDSDSKEFQKRVLQHGTFQDGNPVAPALSTNLDQPEVMDILRKLPKHILEKALEGATENTEQADTASLPGSQGKQSCSFCTKTFVRPCELRYGLSPNLVTLLALLTFIQEASKAP